MYLGFIGAEMSPKIVEADPALREETVFCEPDY